MRLIRESRIDGEFLGYLGGEVYRLSDGKRWRHAESTAEPVYRENPKARLLDDGVGHVCRDVEGTSATVWAKPADAWPTPHAGAF
jgi:hypothetical protein